MRLSKTHHGFTLIEMVVALAVAAILITIAAPSYRSFIANNALVTTANDLVATLAYARSEAITQHTKVSVCPGTIDALCTGDWASGWLVYKGNTKTPNASDVLRIHEPVDGHKIKDNSANTSPITFHSSGFNTIGRTIKFAVDGSNNQACVRLAATGRARVFSTQSGNYSDGCK